MVEKCKRLKLNVGAGMQFNIFILYAVLQMGFFFFFCSTSSFSLVAAMGSVPVTETKSWLIYQAILLLTINPRVSTGDNGFSGWCRFLQTNSSAIM